MISLSVSINLKSCLQGLAQKKKKNIIHNNIFFAYFRIKNIFSIVFSTYKKKEKLLLIWYKFEGTMKGTMVI